ncbi:MAG: hypothetical protein V7K67_29780 [Nostoc sp.]|uniref:hypothetical protein n=1 Tax=Nostoc sp. TaxID=1180 RepID=UPI002FF96A76
MLTTIAGSRGGLIDCIVVRTYATGTIGLGAASRTLNMKRGQLTLCGRVSAFIFGTGNHKPYSDRYKAVPAEHCKFCLSKTKVVERQIKSIISNKNMMILPE